MKAERRSWSSVSLGQLAGPEGWNFLASSCTQPSSNPGKFFTHKLANVPRLLMFLVRVRRCGTVWDGVVVWVWRGGVGAVELAAVWAWPARATPANLPRLPCQLKPWQHSHC